MRAWMVRLHRWFGLSTAVFLFIAGLTGALIAWDHELDELLNPELFRVEGGSPPGDPVELAEELERRDPRLRVTYLPLHTEPGHALMVSVQPRVDPQSGLPYELDFDQLALDPRSGEVLGTRIWGEPSLARKNLMPFLYRLHYSLHLPEAGGVDLGMMLMGIVAVVWTLDGLVALWISFPSRKVWRKSFAFRFKQGAHKLTFDLHRSTGVWLFPVLLVFAVTAVAMNLRDQLLRPVVNYFSPLSPSPFYEPAPEPATTPAVARAQVLATARRQADELGVTAPLGGLYHAEDTGHYVVSFFANGAEHGDGGLGNPRLIFGTHDGRFVASELPGQGSAGDLFMQAQFPLHSGRILGTPGRVLVTLLGLIIALVSATGVWIWARKRRARSRTAAKRERSTVPRSDAIPIR